MTEKLFEICCTTCSARFAVTDSTMIGQIIACPKCGSMILVEAPPSRPEPSPPPVVELAQAQIIEGINSPPIFVTASEPPVIVDRVVSGAIDIPSPPIIGIDPYMDPYMDAYMDALESSIMDIDPPIWQVPRAPNEEISKHPFWNNPPLLFLSLVLIPVLCSMTILVLFSPKGDGKNIAFSNPSPNTSIEETVVTPALNTNEVPLIGDLPSISSTHEEGEEGLLSPVVLSPAAGIAARTSSQPDATSQVSSIPSEGEATSLPIESVSPSGTGSDRVSSPNIPSTDSMQPSSTAMEDESEPIEDKDEDFAANTSANQEKLQQALPKLKNEETVLSIDEQMGIAIKMAEFSHSSLITVMKTLSELTNVPITLNMNQMEILRTTWTIPLELKMETTTTGAILDKTAEEFKLQVVKEADRLVLSSSGQGEFTPVLLDLSDLIGEVPSTSLDSETDFVLSKQISSAKMTRLLETLIDPLSWQNQGGKGTCSWKGTTLIINQLDENIRRIERLLEELRAVRQLSKKKEIPAILLTPEYRCWEQLQTTLSLTYLEATSLFDVLDLIGQKTKLQMIVNRAELAAKGVSSETKITPRTGVMTMDQLLTSLLSSFQLSWIIVASDALVITSREAASDYQTVEMHSYQLFNDKKPMSSATLEAFLLELKEAVGMAHWGDAALSQGGVVWVDTVSSQLLIRQSQPLQRVTRNWLQRRGQPAEDSQ